jgi:hypothetical protein
MSSGFVPSAVSVAPGTGKAVKSSSQDAQQNQRKASHRWGNRGVSHGVITWPEHRHATRDES